MKKFASINLLRGFAIILMVITHSTRLYLNQINNFSEKISYNFLDYSLNFFLKMEPFTSSLFLFLFGYSLIISYSNQKNINLWIKGNIKKAIKLYFLGMVLFFAEKGIQFPDILVSPNILSVISFSLILGTGLLLIKKEYIFYGTFILIGLTSAVIENKFPITGLNVGFGGLFPLILFSGIGMLLGKLNLQKKISLNAINPLWLWLLGFGFIMLFISGDYTSSYYKYYRTFGFHGETGLDFIINIFNQRTTMYYQIGFWNHTVLGFFKLLFPLILSLIIFIKYEDFLNNKYFNWMLILGNNSLNCYLYHLIILAILDTLKIRPNTAILTYLLIGTIISSNIVLIKNQKKAHQV